MSLIMSIACLFIGVYSICGAAKSLKTGVIEQEDGFELRKEKNPLQFRMSITGVRIFGILMILLSIALLAGAFLQTRRLQ